MKAMAEPDSSMPSRDPTRSNIRLTVALVLIFVALVLAGFFHRMTQPRLLTDYELRQNGTILLQTPRKFSSFELTDQRGKPFIQENLKGKWSLLFFGFSQCPDICPTTMAAAARMYEELEPDEKQQLQVVLISLDPERDTPEQLARYVPYFNPDFIGVTGNPFVLLKLATELNVAFSKVELGDGDYSIDHSGNLVIINPLGHYHGFMKPPFQHGSMRTAWRSIRHQF